MDRYSTCTHAILMMFVVSESLEIGVKDTEGGEQRQIKFFGRRGVGLLKKCFTPLYMRTGNCPMGLGRGDSKTVVVSFGKRCQVKSG